MGHHSIYQGIRLHSVKNIERDQMGIKFHVQTHSKTDYTGVGVDRFWIRQVLLCYTYPGVLASNGSLDNKIEMAGMSLLTFSLKKSIRSTQNTVNKQINQL